jgi:hypothetical protein
MPEISRFFGIVIRMYAEGGEANHEPHFHAYYHDDSAAFAIASGALLRGSLPPRQTRLVRKWAAARRVDLETAWEQLLHNQLPHRIEPLE